MNYAIGIDIGATDIKAIAITPEGECLDREMVATEDRPDPVWTNRVRELIADFTRRRGHPPDCVGLAAPGLAHEDGSHIRWMQGRMASLQDFDWPGYLKIPAPVTVLNDAHAALLAEVWIGAAAGLRNVVLLTLGTGVGGAVMVDGRLLRGHIGRAGHLGHMSLDPEGPLDIVGTPGSLEDAVGAGTLRQRSGGRFTTVEALVAAYRDGDDEAGQLWLRAIRALAGSVASLINILDPERIIIGGGMAAAGDALFDPLRQRMADIEWRPGGETVPIVPATLGVYAGALGAAKNAMTSSQGSAD